MVQFDVGVEFPVVLYNGERQFNVGTIEIDPTIDFHKFRSMLKQMTGISYNNLTAYLVEIPSDRRKILITSKADFMMLIQETNAYFLVVIKRSRRDRRRKNNRRNCVQISPADLFDYRFDCYEDDIEQVDCEYGKVEMWLHELEMQRASGSSSSNNNNNNNVNMLMVGEDTSEGFPSVGEAYPAVERSMSRALCDECAHAERLGSEPEFHLCVYDEVVEGFFKSTAGPVSPPRVKVS